MLEAAGYTDKAQRKHNEDAFLLDDEVGLYVVADGVGGLQAGEIASNIVCATVSKRINEGSELEHAIAAAHVEIADAVERGEGKQGMASTIVAALFRGNDYELAWVGDSRIYLWDGEVKLLTNDHSYVQSLYDAGQISLEETDTHPQKNVIMQAVGGTSACISVSTNRGTLGSGDSLLLCSDGVSGEVSGAQMLEFMSASMTPDDVCRELVSCALAAGGKDNATCVYVRMSAQADSDPDGKTTRSIKPEVFRTFNADDNRYSAKPRGVPEPDATQNTETTEATSIIQVAPKNENIRDVVAAEAKPGTKYSVLMLGVGVAIAAAILYLMLGS